VLDINVSVAGCGLPPGLISRIGPVVGRLPTPRARPVFTLLDDQKATLHLSSPPTDPAGNPIPPIVGVPTWADDGAGCLTLTPAADGMSCAVTTTGKLGPTKVTATAMRGAVAVVDDFPIEVDADVQGSLNITADPPTARDLNPAPAPAVATT
jgi:hypothetical protein